jgi:RNA polymerase sigma-70 factor (ECF subfamily)
MQVHEKDEDTLLMARVTGGDTGALCALMDRWQVPLGSFVFRYVQNREASKEIVQECFVRLYEARERFDSSMRFSSWLFKIAANLCKNYYRWRSRHPEDSGLDENCVEFEGLAARDESSPAEQSSRSDDAELVREAVAAMPHALKTALILHYFENMSYAEIAHALGCSQRGVETRLYRARAILARRMGIASRENGNAGRMFIMSGLQ